MQMLFKLVCIFAFFPVKCMSCDYIMYVANVIELYICDDFLAFFSIYFLFMYMTCMTSADPPTAT